jgi:ubiquinone/menaquinone biosynthesis C-methylase UbiE
MNMEYFVRATGPIMEYGKDDVVLDIGCGEGYLAELLRERVREVHGLDVSERSLDHCRAKFAGVPGVHFHKLDERDYTSLAALPERRFSKIVCLSVVQYYDRESDLDALVRSIRRVAAPGARCLIADIPTHGAGGSDALSLLAVAAKEGRLIDTLRYLLKMRLSEYHEVRAKQGLLRYSPENLERLASGLGLEAELLPQQLTVNRSRRHWLLRF